jgi:putative component of membrane protein insertase Oxa1/YidC/SpoIIIJ protein YidD
MKLLFRICRHPLLAIPMLLLFRLSFWLAAAAAVCRPLDRFLGRCARRAVMFYRRHLSAHKGYRCSYAIATGGSTCSTFALEAFSIYGLAGGMSQMSARFGLCGESKLRLQHDKGLIGEALERLPELAKADWIEKDPPCCGC